MAKYNVTSMAAVFHNNAEKFGEMGCVGYKNQQGKYVDVSWNRMKELIMDLGSYLISRGILPNDRVALFSANRYEWWVCDQAILACGAVNVPIYATNSAEEARFILEDSDSKISFVGSQDQLQKVLEAKPRLPILTDIIILDDLTKPVEGVLTFKQAVAKGTAAEAYKELEERIRNINPEDVATLIYTSGTTGNPKGVMLTHNNFVAQCDQCYAIAPSRYHEDHTLISFLPLSHSFERTCGYYLPMTFGKKVIFAEDFSKIMTNFREIRPTLIVSVPRLFEKIHAGILAKVAKVSPRRQKIFAWALELAYRNVEYICDNERPRQGWFAVKYFIADRLIFRTLKKLIGLDNLKFALSGGGPLSIADAEFFLGMGIKVLEGYGLSETCPIVTANREEKIKPGTVGPALKDTIIKIGEGGEVLIKGPQVMKGYFKNDAATNEVFTADGFFQTGDIGEIDSDGYLKITGRIKDLIITSGGKNVSPQNIETSLSCSKFIEQVAIIGDNRKFLTALIVPAFPELEGWAKENKIRFDSPKDLIENQSVKKLIGDEIASYTKDYARVEQIKNFTLLENEWTQESDELTPTQKLKRRVINQKYAKQIDCMYPEDNS